MQNERYSKIMESLEKSGSVEVRQLSAEFGVTEKTIRHDLIELEKQGLLKRVHGGAIQSAEREGLSYTETMRTLCLNDKVAIAHAALNYILNGTPSKEIFFLDAGTTIYQLALLLKNISRLTVITNDVMIATQTTSSSWNLHLTGGFCQYQVNRYLIGPDAIDMINRHWITTAFIGAFAINPGEGFMTMTNEDAQIKQAAISRADRTVCLADHTKFNQNAFVKYANVEDIDVLITDEKASDDQLSILKEKGVSVIVAHEDTL